MAWKWTAGKRKLTHGFRSGFEKRLADQLSDAGVDYAYEAEKLKYTVPARNATYTPDFFLPNGIIIEAKGRFRTAEDRQKLILVREAHPELDLRLVFQNAKLPIYKGSKTTYAMWADSHGFLWADKTIPLAWITEQEALR
jgi:hypothetical protein